MTPTISIPKVPSVVPSLSTPLMSAEEFVRKYENKHAELLMGVVTELPMPTRKHGYICSEVAFYLRDHVKKHDLGRVMVNDSFVKIRQNPDTVRGTDIDFISYERLPRGDVPEGLLDAVPELVFEVRSPSNTWSSLVAKALEFFSVGVQVVVVIDPPTQSASVYRPDARTDIFESHQELTLPDILPGFAVLVRKFFE